MRFVNLSTTVVTLVGAVLIAATSVAAAAPVPAPPCRPVAVPTPVDGRTVTVRGTLCTPLGEPAPTTVEVLVPGVTYDSAYWLTPATPGGPSYVSAALANGNATLAFDPPGRGISDRVRADEANLATNVAVVHQIAGALHDGQLGARFPTVVGVGHSFGSSIALAEAAQYDDLQGVVASGFAHGVNSDGITAFFNSLVPTGQDPVLRAAGYPDGYFTTKAGTRAASFYRDADADRVTQAVDEATKSVITTGEENGIAAVAADPTITQKIRVPVLVVDGQLDGLFCGTMVDCSSAATLRGYEAPFFSAAARLDAFVLTGSGHSVNLHRNSPDWFSAANAWVRTVR